MPKIKRFLQSIYLLPRALVGLFILKETRIYAILVVILISAGTLGFNLWDKVFRPGLETNHLTAQISSGPSQPAGTPAPETNPIQFNLEEYHLPEKINPGGLNFIFFADQYSSWDEFEKDIEVLMTELKKIEPWQSYDLYNIFRINPKTTGLCYVKVQDERKPVLRCREEINNYLNNLLLERFKLIVLSRQDFQSWANLVRLENSGIFFSLPAVLLDDISKKTHGLLFSHLLGHAFGLKDEEIFVLAQAGGAPHTPDGPNCAPDAATAQKWWGDLAKKYPEVGYFKGCCGDENFIKPTQSSIMNLNTGAPIVYNYGPVSEQYLKKVLDYCVSPGNYNEAINDKEFFGRFPEFQECLK